MKKTLKLILTVLFSLALLSSFVACGELKDGEYLKFTLSDDGTYYSVTGTGTFIDRDIVIPDTHEGLPVTSIEDNAFKPCYYLSSGLKSVVIGDNVTSIGGGAFYDCDDLTSVVIPDSVETIGNSAFNGCSSLKTVTFEENSRLSDIGGCAFSGCSNLTSVVIPDSVTSIGGGPFSGCHSLTSITVSENNTAYKSIDGNLYSKDGTTLIQYAIGRTDTSFTIPDSVTGIGEWAFCGCESLTSVVIPDSVTSIGSSAFSRCGSLTSVVIPDSVTSIGSYAFDWCNSLTDVYYTGTEEEWAAISIGWNNSKLTSATIHYNYVPEE